MYFYKLPIAYSTTFSYKHLRADDDEISKVSQKYGISQELAEYYIQNSTSIKSVGDAISNGIKLSPSLQYLSFNCPYSNSLDVSEDSGICIEHNKLRFTHS